MRRGEAIGGTNLRQTAGDSATTDLTLTSSTFDRRDYSVHYDYQANLPIGGGQYTYQVPISNQNYSTVTLDIMAYNPANNNITLSLDVGANGSVEWMQSVDVSLSGGLVHASGLAAAVNAYLDTHSGGVITVPMRLTANTQGTYFLTNFRSILSTDHDLSILGSITMTNTIPTETDVVQLCVPVVNEGLGKVPAAVTTFFVNDPTIHANVLIDYSVLTGLEAEGGQAQGCVDWDTTGYTGNLTLYAYVDFLNQVEEHNETNNVISTTISVRTRPDLYVPAIALANPEPTAGQPVTVQVSLRNKGQTSAGSSTLVLYDGNPASGGTLLGEYTGAPLAGGVTITIPIIWTPATPGLHRLFVQTDQANTVNEFDEGNNWAWQDV